MMIYMFPSLFFTLTADLINIHNSVVGSSLSFNLNVTYGANDEMVVRLPL